MDLGTKKLEDKMDDMLKCIKEVKKIESFIAKDLHELLTMAKLLESALSNPLVKGLIASNLGGSI